MGMISNWRDITVEILAEKIGPVAIVIVNDVAKELGISSTVIDRKTYSEFLMRLSRELPAGVSAVELAKECRNRIAS
jgi:hypothetical protein